MAKLYPDSARTRVVFASRAEEFFYEECRRSLGAQWKVFHSVTLTAIESGELRDNEIDFVLYHPKFGIICIEVKGGRIRFDVQTQNFFSVNRNDQSFAIKNPFAQALNWKSRLLRQLKERGVRVPVTQAVSFPNVEAAEFPKAAGLEPELIIGRESFANLEQVLKELVRKVQPERYLRFEDCGAAVEEVLIGRDFCTKSYFREYVDAHEARVRDIETIHEGLITPVTSAKELGIEGEAGTGKTILAASVAKHFRDQSLSVLMLTSNELLSNHLRHIVGKDVQLLDYMSLGRIKNSNTRYDVIICDEAQDVQPAWWDVIKALKRGEKSRLYVFFDRSQGIFGTGGGGRSFVPEEILPVKPPYFPLVHNYRTTREIASFARMFRTGSQILASHTDRLGYLPQIVYYKDPQDAQKKLRELVSTLVNSEGIRAEEIALLSARRPQQRPSIIAGVNDIGSIPIYSLQGRGGSNEALFKEKSIVASTVGSFKGLETKIGILINFSEYNMPLTNPLMASLFYVAATRAKHMLYVFLRDDDKKRYSIDLALKNIGLTGGIVIDSSEFGVDLVGEVVHYNPERVGWLKVEDPKFAKANVMFFPSDLAKARIRDVKPGDHLSFRPRVEGHATIATDLGLLSGDSGAHPEKNRRREHKHPPKKQK